MIGLFDSDVYLKLCCCNLWSEALVALEISTPYRLPQTAKASWVKNKLRKKLSEGEIGEVLARVEAVNAAVEPLPDDYVEGLEAHPVFKAMTGVDDINDGEQILAAILIRDPNGKTLLSGDKRFINAFREAFPKEWAALSNAIISFEMCLEAIERVFGYDYVYERTAPIRHCDGTLGLAIGDKPDRDKFLACITSYNPCRVVVEITQVTVVAQI